jgi:prepilin-type N-terminal cleavage/methylation domain-containing protein/prepilin-type processing-associated H-X9-DG protein
MSRIKAFTLVELLVVISIIAVMVAILLPALTKAREAAVTVNCLSSMKQCFLGFEMYKTAYNGVIPQRASIGGGYYMWPWFLVEGGNAMAGTGHRKFVDRKIVACPANNDYDKIIKEIPNLTYAYGLYAPEAQSEFMQLYDMEHKPTIWESTHWFFVQRPNRLKRINMVPARAMMLADTAMGQYTPGRMYGVWKPDGDHNWSTAIQTVHNNRANVVFYDGHGETLTDKQMRFETDTKCRWFKKTTSLISYNIP